ncbi:TPA: outer membrane protein assembly factor BamA [bacterium]|nr:outer membrane protein assembly factor BamA [bacterium]
MDLLDKTIKLMRKTLFFVIFLTYISFSSVIEKISFEGNERMGEDEIRKILTIKEGDEFFEWTETSSIKEIYSMAEFDDVSVKIEKENGSITIIFFLKECPIIKKITFSGYKKKKLDELKKEIIIKEGGALFIPKIHQSKEKLTSFYRKEGYYFAEVVPKIDGENVTFEIKEGDEAKIKKVRFFGNKAFSSFKLKWKIKTGKGDAYIKEKVDEDIERLVYFYKEEGFAKVVIEPKLSFDDKKKGLVLDINISEGSRYKIRKIDVFGNTIIGESKIRDVIPIKEEGFYNIKLIEKSLNNIGRLYYEKGYISANIVLDEIFDLEKKLVDCRISIDEDELSYVEKITIVGNKKTKDNVIRRELFVKEGDLLLWDKVVSSKQRLISLGYFDGVDIDILPGSHKNKKILKIKIEEGGRGTALFGISYTSQYGVLGNIQTNFINLFGKGYSLNIKGDFGKKMTNYEISFNDPWFLNTPTSLGFGLWNQRLKRDYYSERKNGGYISLGRPFKETNRAFLKYRLNRSKFEDLKDNAPSDVWEWKKKWKDRYAVTSSIELGLIHDTRRPSIFDPTLGCKVSPSIQIAGGVLGGDVEFYKPNFEGMWYIPSFHKFVLVFHTDFGFIQGKNIPDSERFYLGGENTIRGYDGRSIHPKEGGGDSFFIFNTAYRFPIAKGVSFDIFLDCGNTWRRGKEELLNLYFGGGFGVKFNSPIGPLRFDYAWPLTKEKTPKFYFSIGESF